MAIILDTDVVIEILDRHSKKGSDALEKVRASKESIGITSITLHELLYGLEKYAKQASSEISQLPVIEYGRDDAILSAKLELATERKGASIRRTDAMIAAIVVNRSALLYTFDKHFLALRDMGLNLFI